MEYMDQKGVKSRKDGGGEGFLEEVGLESNIRE